MQNENITLIVHVTDTGLSKIHRGKLDSQNQLKLHNKSNYHFLLELNVDEDTATELINQNRLIKSTSSNEYALRFLNEAYIKSGRVKVTKTVFPQQKDLSVETAKKMLRTSISEDLS